MPLILGGLTTTSTSLLNISQRQIGQVENDFMIGSFKRRFGNNKSQLLELGKVERLGAVRGRVQFPADFQAALRRIFHRGHCRFEFTPLLIGGREDDFRCL